MGMILGPGMLFHLIMFVAAVVLILFKTSGWVDRSKFVALSAAISFAAAHFFVRFIFSRQANSRVSAFQMIFDVVYGKYIVAALVIAGLLYWFGNKNQAFMLHFLAADFMMFPFAGVVLYFAYAEKLLKTLNIQIYY